MFCFKSYTKKKISPAKQQQFLNQEICQRHARIHIGVKLWIYYVNKTRLRAEQDGATCTNWMQMTEIMYFSDSSYGDIFIVCKHLPLQKGQNRMSLHNCLTCNVSNSAPETQIRKPFFIQFLARFIHQHFTKICSVKADLLFPQYVWMENYFQSIMAQNKTSE